MSKFVGIGPSSYEERIYRAAVSRKLRNTGLDSRRLIFSEVNSELHPARVKYIKVEEEGEEEKQGEAVTERESCIMKCCIIWITAIK